MMKQNKPVFPITYKGGEIRYLKTDHIFQQLIDETTAEEEKFLKTLNVPIEILEDIYYN